MQLIQCNFIWQAGQLIAQITSDWIDICKHPQVTHDSSKVFDIKKERGFLEKDTQKMIFSVI